MTPSWHHLLFFLDDISKRIDWAKAAFFPAFPGGTFGKISKINSAASVALFERSELFMMLKNFPKIAG